MIPFAPQDLFSRSWSLQGANPFAAPHAPFIGSFNPQIPQALLSSFTSAPWLGSSYSPFASSPWTGNSSLNSLGLAALQQGFLSPFSGWQTLGTPFGTFATGGLTDLSPFTAGRQAYLPGFYPTNYIPTAHPGAIAGGIGGAGLPQQGFYPTNYFPGGQLGGFGGSNLHQQGFYPTNYFPGGQLGGFAGSNLHQQGFYPTNFFPGAQPGGIGGSTLQQPAFSA